MSLNDNVFTSVSSDSTLANVLTNAGGPASATVSCPGCEGDLAVDDSSTGWQICPYCHKRLRTWIWPVVRQNSSAVAALSEQATCFFHPDKAFHVCCQRCGRFVCALCDLQVGAEHVCPTCFERGRDDSGKDAGKAEWRYRDVLYDSIALVVGWGWIIFWPTFVVALPTVIILHVKYRKAPRSYVIPRSGWRFWIAYVGLAWIPILLTASLLWARVRGQ